MPDKKTGTRYRNVEDNDDFEDHLLYRNTAIPDDVFGPDEERIFIDVDPYDLDAAIFGVRHEDDVDNNNNKRTTGDTSLDKKDFTTVTKANVDHVEESLKNVKRHWQDTFGDVSRYNKRNDTYVNDHPDETINSAASSDNVGLEVYYIQDTTTRNVAVTSALTTTTTNEKSIFDNRFIEENTSARPPIASIFLNETEPSTRMIIDANNDDGSSSSFNVVKSRANGDKDEDSIYVDELEKRRANDHDEDRIATSTKHLEIEDDGDSSTTMDDETTSSNDERISLESTEQIAREFSSHRRDRANSRDNSKEETSSDTLTTSPGMDKTESMIGSIAALGKKPRIFANKNVSYYR